MASESSFSTSGDEGQFTEAAATACASIRRSIRCQSSSSTSGGNGNDSDWTCSTKKDANTFVINDPEDWSKCHRTFFQSVGALKVVGLDCEWVEPSQFEWKERRFGGGTSNRDPKRDETRIANGSSGKVALLQMGSQTGMTVLIRLCYFTDIPRTLKSFLEDGNVLKLGVNIENDARKLFVDWDINLAGFVDLRSVVIQNPLFLDDYLKKGLGLKKLGNFLTGANCDESHNLPVRTSHWAAPDLDGEQIDYARNDALMSIKGFLVFADKYVVDLPPAGLPRYVSDRIAALRQMLTRHAGRKCSNNVMRMFERAKVANSPKTTVTDEQREKARRLEQRRVQRELSQETYDSSDSEIELDFDRWRKSAGNKKFHMLDGMQRAVVFYERSTGEPAAAIDGALLKELDEADKDGDSGPHKIGFALKNDRGRVVAGVGVELKKKN